MSNNQNKTIHEGDLTIREGDDYSHITKVTGFLEIHAESHLPALTEVGGFLHIRAESQLPALTEVGGPLYIRAESQLPALTEVGGSLYIHAESHLPALTEVGVSLHIRAESQLPALTEVGGSLYIHAESHLPALTEVKEHARISRGKTLDAPNARIIGGEFHGIAADDEYELFRSADGMYVAGCRGPWSASEALDHWLNNSRPDNQSRAALFVDAIQSAEAVS